MDGVEISVQELVSGIVSAFRTNTLEVALIAGLILALVGTLVAYWMVSRLRRRRRREAFDAEIYEKLKSERGLDADDEILIDRLAQHLETPLKKHLIARNKAVYNSCARSLVAEDSQLSDAISALRVKLGFPDARPDQALASTTEIPVGGSVLVILPDDRSAGARVIEQEADAVVVTPRTHISKFQRDQMVTVLYHNRTGVYSFTTTVLSTEGDRVRIDHSEYPQQIQRRRYYRQPVKRPACIRPAAGEEPHDDSQFIEIGGGGASLRNPHAKYGPGEDIEISFSPESDGALSVAAQVVRTSSGGDVIHVRYTQLRESTRDKIYRIIFGD